MADYTYLISSDGVFVAAEGKSWNVTAADRKRMEDVLRLIKEGAGLDRLKEVLDADSGESLRKWCEEQLDGNDAGISVGTDTVEIDGEPVYGSLCRQIVEMNEQGFPLDPLVNFVRKMRQNPSYRIREQLWGFIEACQKDGGFTLHNDGDIMAYKIVREDFYDCHSGQFDNHPGCIVSMPRAEVDDDPHHTCSAGLHFCAYSYVGHYGSGGESDRLMLVKVNPKDVVSIPEDYGNAKARCCRYEVVSEVSNPLKKPVYDGGGSRRDKADFVYSVRINSKGERYVFKSAKANEVVPFEVDDVVMAETSSYDGDIHIGRIVRHDPEDADLEWCVRFVDHEKGCVVNWWVSGDDLCYPSEKEANAEDFSLMDEPDLDYDISTSIHEIPKELLPLAVGDTVAISEDGQDGVIVDELKTSGAHFYRVKYEDEDGYSHEGIFSADALERIYVDDEEDGDGEDEDFFSRFREECVADEIEDIVKKVGKEGADALRILLNALMETAKDGRESEDSGEDDEADAELWVESWLDSKSRQTIAKMLESEFKEMLDERITARLALASSTFNCRIVKAEIEMWLAEKERIHSSDTLWKTVQSRIRDWMKREGGRG